MKKRQPLAELPLDNSITDQISALLECECDGCSVADV